MKSLQKAGGLGALLLGVAFVLLILSNAVIQPSLGIGGDDGLNPAKLALVASTARLLFGLPILFAVGLALASLGLSDRLQERSPALLRIASASGLGSAVLFLAAGMVAFSIVPVAAQYSASLTTSQVALVVALDDGLLSAAIFAAGWFVLLASWAAMRGGLPQILSYIGLLFGVLSVFAFLTPLLSIIGAFVGVVWALWTGIALWQG